MENRKYMTIKEYAIKYSITRQTIYNRIKKGTIVTTRIGSQQLIPIG